MARCIHGVQGRGSRQGAEHIWHIFICTAVSSPRMVLFRFHPRLVQFTVNDLGLTLSATLDHDHYVKSFIHPFLPARCHCSIPIRPLLPVVRPLPKRYTHGDCRVWQLERFSYLNEKMWRLPAACSTTEDNCGFLSSPEYFLIAAAGKAHHQQTMVRRSRSEGRMCRQPL